MASRDRETIKESLQKKGFTLKEGGDHWRFIYMSRDGRKTSVNTKMSRGTKYRMINDGLLAQMSKQCKLQKADFIELIDCTLTRDSYEMKLRNQGFAN
ncbi:hypothetical protein R83H12_01093 [Fibrobacteria bacterium R8-3-H12]